MKSRVKRIFISLPFPQKVCGSCCRSYIKKAAVVKNDYCCVVRSIVRLYNVSETCKRQLLFKVARTTMILFTVEQTNDNCYLCDTYKDVNCLAWNVQNTGLFSVLRATTNALSVERRSNGVI